MIMKKSVKKFFACIFSLTIMLMGICGCVNKNEQNNQSPKTTVLEDFSDDLSSYCLAGATRFKSEQTRGEYLDSYTDKNGEVAHGVGYASLRKVDNCMVVRFNKSVEELALIYDEIESITVRILVKHGTDLNREISIFGVGKSVVTNVWTDFTVTKTEIINCLNNNALQNMVSAKTQFVNNFHSTAVAHEPRMISTICNGFNTDVYIDSIVYKPVTKA
jgi:hypothetical protein